MSGSTHKASRAGAKLRVLIVDDSAYNRRHIAEAFVDQPDIEVVGKASDGEEALRMSIALKPDVITLDLEMPRMDGFTFLRILMARQPTPVIVVSSYSQQENVFKALELGAVDFVTKPNRQLSPESVEIQQQILEKVQVVRTLRPTILDRLARAGAARRLTPTPASMGTAAERATLSELYAKLVPSRPGDESAKDAPASDEAAVESARLLVAPRYLVVIASSTGGPTALLEVVGRLPKRSVATFVIAQHMPDKFTRAFAERLSRRGTILVTEAQDGDCLHAGTGFVCPGRQCVDVSEAGADWILRVGSAASTDRYVPSADRLFRSAAAVAKERAVGVVLTGMGDDGTEGAKAIRDAGGLVIAESQESAVVNGMPGSAIRAGAVHEVLSLAAIADRLAGLAEVGAAVHR